MCHSFGTCFYFFAYTCVVCAKVFCFGLWLRNTADDNFDAEWINNNKICHFCDIYCTFAYEIHILFPHYHDDNDNDNDD